MATRKMVDTSTGELAEITVDPHAWVNKEAKGIDFVPSNWEELEAAFKDEGGIIEFEGSPWQTIEKGKLVDVPFMIADVREWTSKEYNRPVVAVMVITKDTINGKTQHVFSDGSTGVFEQVTGMVRRTGRKSGIMCPNGLRRSDYEVEDPFEPGGDPIKATTFYVQ